MSARCSGIEVDAAIRRRGLSEGEARRISGLVQQLDAGYDHGTRYRYRGERPPPGDLQKPAAKPPDPLPFEQYLSAGAMAAEALYLIDELQPYGAAPLLAELDPLGRLDLVEVLAECGRKPIDVWPAWQQNALAWHLLGRDMAAMPADWDDLILQLGAGMVLANLVDPDSLVAAHREGVA